MKRRTTTTITPPPVIKGIPQGIYDLMSGKLTASNGLGPNEKACLIKPFCEGLRLKTDWVAVEPAEGQRDWTALDTAIAYVSSQGKKCGIGLNAGIACPFNWLLPLGMKTYTLLDSSGNAGLQVPMPNDLVFMTHWRSFVAAFGAKYDGNPDVRFISMGGIGNHEEWNIFGGAQDSAYWDTPTRLALWVTGAKAVIDMYMAAFPHTTVHGSLATPVNGIDGINAMIDVADYARATYGAHFLYFFSGLNPNSGIGYPPAGQIDLHWKTNPTGAQFGPVGALPLTDANDALVAAELLHVRYVELYPQNILNPDYASMLTQHNSTLKAIPVPPVP